MSPPHLHRALTPEVPALHVSGLDKSVTKEILSPLFSQFGTIDSIHVVRDRWTGESRGYAYVNYDIPANGAKALENLNNTIIEGHPCRIQFRCDPAMRKTSKANIYIKNLPTDVDDKALQVAFAKYGEIQSCKVALDDSGVSKGHGFIQYTDDEAACRAIEAAHLEELMGKPLFVCPFVPKKDRQCNSKEAKKTQIDIHIKNVAPQTTDQEFRQLFTRFGKVRSISITRDENGISQGFAFVSFINHTHAEAAVEQLNGKEFMGKDLQMVLQRPDSPSQDDQTKKDEKTMRNRQVLSKSGAVENSNTGGDDSISTTQTRQALKTVHFTRPAQDPIGQRSGVKGHEGRYQVCLLFHHILLDANATSCH
jgi:polyadenylate-binding protein